MKKKLTILCLLTSLFAFAQKDSTILLKKNSLNFQAGGISFFPQVNYERIFYQKKKLKLNASIGIDPVDMFFAAVFNGPKFIGTVESDAMLGRKNNFLEMGIGNLLEYKSSGEYPRRKTESYLLYGPGDPDGFQYGVKDVKTVNYYQAKFNMRIGYRYQNVNKKFYFRIAWIPTVILKLGYKMEPYDQLIRLRGSIWGDSYYNDYRPIPSEYHPSGHGVESIAEIYTLNGAFTIGYLFR
ncbi:MAG: hypothetical protein HY064_05920 [Bacteroidetes bacterium]|nr:hypothetical protein [Bacteroidota bacterium]